MSPIPPVLVLSFLLLPPLAEAEEMMDPFALIRETLKYWRRIYEMYQEEVDLGYCWAEYFLRSENATKNVQMSHSVDHDWLNFELEEGRLPRVTREDRVHSTDSRRERVRGKRSLEILNSVDRDGEISIAFGDMVRHSDGTVISKVYSKNRGNSMAVDCCNQVWDESNSSRGVSGLDDARQPSSLTEGLQKGANDQVSGFTVNNVADKAETSSPPMKYTERHNEEKPSVHSKARYDLALINARKHMFPCRRKENCKCTDVQVPNKSSYLLPTSLNGSSLKISKENPIKNDNKGLFIQELKTWKVYSKTAKTRRDLKSADCRYRVFKKDVNQLSDCDDVKKSSSFLAPLLNVYGEVSTVSKEGMGKSGILRVHSTSGCDLESMNRRKHTLHYRGEKGRQFLGIYSVNGSFYPFLYGLNASRFMISNISKKDYARDGDRSSFNQSTGHLKIYSTNFRMKNKLNSINWHKYMLYRRSKRNNQLSIIKDGATRPSSLPSWLNTFTRNGELPPNSKKVVRAQFDPVLKRIQAGGEPYGKSKGPEMDAYRKLLSAYSPRRAFTLKVSHPRSQKSFDVPFPSLGGMASLDSRFKWKDTTKKLDHNTDRKHPSCRKGFDSLNPEIQGAEQRPRSLDGTYRRSLRRKRDANDRIRLLEPLAESKRPSYVEPVNKTRRLLASSVYTVPKSTLWRAFNFKRNEGNNNEHRSRMRTNYTNLPSENSSPFYSKYHKNLSRRRKLVLPVTLTKPYEDPLPLVNSYGILRQSPRYVFLKPSIKDHKPEYTWEGGSSKQLTTLDHDNKYRGTEFTGLFPVGESVLEETGKKEAIQDPMGRPSLLPVSYQRFMGDYGSWESGTSRNSGPTRSSRVKNQGRRVSSNLTEARGHGRMLTSLFDLRAVFMAFLRSLGFFVQVGREIIDYVESNMALACTKDYLWSKIVQWIDS